jgi:uncharacterized MAPEG superfamily protein
MIGFPSVLAVYTAARLCFVISYYFGKQPFRTISFAVGALGLIIMGFWALVAFLAYYQRLIPGMIDLF